MLKDKEQEISWEDAIQFMKDKEALNQLDKKLEEEELMDYEESNEADWRKSFDPE